MIGQLNVDLMSRGSGQGEVANYLQKYSALNTNKMRPYLDSKGRPCVTVFDAKGKPRKIQINAATLRRDEWKMLDEALTEVKRERLTGFDYIVGKGLTKPLSNPMGTTVLEWHSISDSQEAVMTMDGVTRGQGDRSVYKHHYLPIPIMHVDYEINMRALEVSRNMGDGFDVTEAQHAARRIREKKEELLFTDTTYSYGAVDSNSRNSIYSLVNYPDRNTVTLSENWDASGKTAAEIIEDVVSMKDANIAAKHYGPYTLFIPTAYDTVIDGDYSVSGASMQTIRQRILAINNISDVVVVDTLPANNVLLVQMTPDVVRVVNGLPLQNIQWKTEGNFVVKNKVIEIAVPQIRSDYNGNCGIAHLAA